jgi:hypothetical protein
MDLQGNQEDEYVLDGEGSELRIMWDMGAGPLWTSEDGLLPDDPEWLKRALGLSESLVADLLEWLHAMDDADAHRRPPPSDLHERAEQLSARLQTEVGSRFEVRYHR